jgi:hypothetical protein
LPTAALGGKIYAEFSMETIAITSQNAFSLEQIERALVPHYQVAMSNEGGIAINGPGTRAYIHADKEPESAGIHRLLIDYSDVEFVKTLLAIVADDPDLLIDNDFGTVLPGDQFVARTKADKGWNWRHYRGG